MGDAAMLARDYRDHFGLGEVRSGPLTKSAFLPTPPNLLILMVGANRLELWNR
jgi:hypothetical protein